MQRATREEIPTAYKDKGEVVDGGKAGLAHEERWFEIAGRRDR